MQCFQLSVCLCVLCSDDNDTKCSKLLSASLRGTSGIQAWSPYLRIDMLEKIHRRATKLIPGLRDLTYEEQLKECGLTTLETRRLRGLK